MLTVLNVRKNRVEQDFIAVALIDANVSTLSYQLFEADDLIGVDVN
jgi:hypothetical protein